jgi:uncharacterized membrane protein YbhN (UPF0104 family)
VSETDDSPNRKRLLSIAGRILRWILILAVAAFAVWYFIRMWPQVSVALSAMNPVWVGLSFLILLIGLAMNTLSWTTLLRGLGHTVPIARAAQIMLVGQLGKYVPGSVWAYLLQMELGRQYGVARARVLVASLYAAGIGVVSSLIFAALAAPQISVGNPSLLWLFALLPVCIVFLHPRVMTFFANLALRVFRRPPLEHQVRFATVATALGWSLASYGVYGAHLWLLTNGSVPVSAVILMAAAISLGFTAGLFAFVLPSGFGVREAVMISTLVLLLPSGEAAAIALVSRGMFTAGDLLTAGIAAVVAFALRRRLHREDVSTAEYSDVAEETESR